MSFPIFFQGQILFRNGAPAFSTNCCCDVTFLYKTCVAVRIAGVGTPNDISIDPPLEFGNGRGKIVFHGSAKDTDSIPIGSFYHTILWIVEFCGTSENEIYGYQAELERWARIDGMTALTGSPDPETLTDYAIPLASCSDFHANAYIDQLVTPGNYIRNIFLDLQPRVRCPDTIYIGG